MKAIQRANAAPSGGSDHQKSASPALGVGERLSCSRFRRVLLLVCMGALAAGTGAPVWAAIPTSERQVLLNLYVSTNGAAWGNNTGWNGAAGSECGWQGITCDASETHVIEVALGYNFLSGSLPALDGLTALQTFHVNDNSLTGPIPALQGLTALQFFDATGNYLTGPIPALSGMTTLISFQVTSNQLSGAIPALRNLPNLQLFYVNDNLLTGSIPPLDALGALNILEVSYNQLTGSIPALAALTQLSVFEAEFNHLDGTIPALTGLSQLEFVLLDHNQLTGPVPAPPIPNQLLDGSSTLCPNPLTPNASATWDAATGITPWYSACDPIFQNGFE